MECSGGDRFRGGFQNGIDQRRKSLPRYEKRARN